MRAWLLGLAAVWMAVGAAAQAPTTATLPADVEALLALRSSLTNLPVDWFTSDDPCGTLACGPMLPTRCAWTGLACNASRVVAIWLPCLRDWCFNLGGTLAPGLAGASELQLLEVQGNSIGGTLPPEWGSLGQLAVLSAGYNSLTGTLPPQFGNLSSLQHLRLTGNRLGGSLPPAFGALVQLRELLLGSNSLTGSFPPEFVGMTNVQVMVFERNELSGSLPSNWQRLVQLQLLDVRGMCRVCGPVPFTQVVRLGVTGSSLGWPCGSGNCGSLPLGFLGQAVIISSVLVVLLALCFWRRIWLFRRHGLAGQRTGLGLVRAAISSRAPRPPPTEQRREEVEAGAPRPPPAPPVVVLQPDHAFCTARMDAEWAAALQAAGVENPAAKAWAEQEPVQQVGQQGGGQQQRRWLGVPLPGWLATRRRWAGAQQQEQQQEQQPAPPAAPQEARRRSLELVVAQAEQQVESGSGAGARASSATGSSDNGGLAASSQAANGLLLASMPSQTGPQQPGSSPVRRLPSMQPSTSGDDAAPEAQSSTAAMWPSEHLAAMSHAAPWPTTAQPPAQPAHPASDTMGQQLSRQQPLDATSAMQPGGEEARSGQRSQRRHRRRMVPMFAVDVTAAAQAEAEEEEGPGTAAGVAFATISQEGLEAAATCQNALQHGRPVQPSQ